MTVFANSHRAIRSAMRLSGRILFALTLASVVIAEPQYIRNLSENGFLSSPTVDPPVVTLTAGQRFLDLVPDSQLELCEIAREYYASANAEVNTVRVVSASGQILLSCGG